MVTYRAQIMGHLVICAMKRCYMLALAYLVIACGLLIGAEAGVVPTFIFMSGLNLISWPSTYLTRHWDFFESTAVGCAQWFLVGCLWYLFSKRKSA